MKKAHLNLLAKKLLKDFGIQNPNNNQISKMEDLLKNNSIQANLLLDNKLTAQEKNCLLLAAHGKTSSLTASLLNISKDTVESHRKEIRRKLECNSMAQAVYQGMRYGFINEAAL